MTVTRSVAALAGALLAVAPAAPAHPDAGAVVLLLPLQNRAGDRNAGEAIQEIVTSRLTGIGRLIGRERARDALRRRRVRHVEDATPEALRGVAHELAADLLVSVILHDAERRGVPRLALSARAYSGVDGSLLWAGFAAGSGLDRRRLLGLGLIYELEDLVPGVVDRLFDGGPPSGTFDAALRLPGAERASGPLGAVALVPFTSVIEQRTYATAETATEATRAVLHRLGIRVVSPGCASTVLRRLQGGVWGGIDSEARLGLRSECGAQAVVTGSLEAYESGGTLTEPEPQVALGLRLVDSATGRILWTDGRERSGWAHGGPFRLRRIYARAALAERLLENLTRRLLKEVGPLPLPKEES